jgi:hypothetical protein
MKRSELRDTVIGFLTAMDGAYHLSGVLAQTPDLKEMMPEVAAATERFHESMKAARMAAYELVQAVKAQEAKRVNNARV